MLLNIAHGLELIACYDAEAIAEAADGRLYVEIDSNILNESDKACLKQLNWIKQEDGFVYYT